MDLGPAGASGGPGLRPTMRRRRAEPLLDCNTTATRLQQARAAKREPKRTNIGKKTRKKVILPDRDQLLPAIDYKRLSR
jgi:hypothetical protein